MLRFGTICDTDHDGGLYRVNLEGDGLVSYWLSPTHLTTRNAKPFAPLSIGEHVACLFDEALEDGVIIGAIYSGADEPRGEEHRTFIDFLNKVSVEYDSNAGAFIFSNQDVTVTIAGDKVTIEKGADSLGTVLSDLLDAMSLETHTAVSLGAPTSPPLNAASYAAIKTRLLQLIG